MRWMRWHCPSDTGFEIRALSVLGQAGYLSVTEAPHNMEHLLVSVFFFKLEGQSGVRTRDLRHSKQAALTHAPYRAPANQPR